MRKLTQGLQLDLSRPVRSYSHGNRKKLGLIQALIHRPRLLILDEPTSGLDPLVRLELFDLLRELNREGVSIFFSTHVLEEVDRICTSVGIIKEGKLVRCSRLDELPGRRMRIVTLKLAGDVHPEKALPGWGRPKPLADRPGHYRLTVDAPVNAIVTRLSQVNLEYLTITDPSIEDVLLGLYEPERGKQG